MATNQHYKQIAIALAVYACLEDVDSAAKFLLPGTCVVGCPRVVTKKITSLGSTKSEFLGRGPLAPPLP